MITAALTAAAGFGAADWLGGAATARTGSVRRVLLVSEPVAALALLAALMVVPGRPSTGALLVGLLAGLGAGVGQACLYTALATGPAAVAAPVCGIVSIVVPVAWAAADGQPLDGRQWAGAALVAVAIVLLCGMSTRTDPSASAFGAFLRTLLGRPDPPAGGTGPPGGPIPPTGPPGPSPGDLSHGTRGAAGDAVVAVIDAPSRWSSSPSSSFVAHMRRLGPRGRTRDVVLAAVAGAGFGVYTIVLGLAPTGSALWPVVIAHAALAAAALGLLAAAAVRRPGAHRSTVDCGTDADRRTDADRPTDAGRSADEEGISAADQASGQGGGPAARSGRSAGLGVAVLLGLAEAVAAAATLLAARTDIAVTAAIVAAHPAVTVLLARHLDRQQLGVTAAAGLVFTSAGLLLLAG